MGSLLGCPTWHDRCGQGCQVQTLKWQCPHLVSPRAPWWPGLWWDRAGNKRGGFLMHGCLESCSSEKRSPLRTCSVTLVWAAGMSCPPEMVASMFGGQEKSEHHLLSEQVCAPAHELSGWCNMLMMVLGLFVCPALGRLQGHSPCGVPGAPASCALHTRRPCRWQAEGVLLLILWLLRGCRERKWKH